MGSCFSKKKQIPSPSSPPPPAKRHIPKRLAPPAVPAFVEEAVKEVLPISETPQKPKSSLALTEIIPIPEKSMAKPLLPIIKPESAPSAEKEESKFCISALEAGPSPPKVKEVEAKENTPAVLGAGEASEVSGSCSASDAISGATNAEKAGEGAENGCEEVEMREKGNRSPAGVRRKRSLAEDSAGKADRRAKSPARRLEASPSKATRARIQKEIAGSRGEAGQRRSRSPAMRKELGRSPSGRRTSASPRRKPAEPPTRKAEEEGAAAAVAAAAAVDAPPGASKESLQNPFVAMECFIFL